MNNDELSLEIPQSLLVTWKIPIFFHLSKYKACWLLSPNFQFGSNVYHLRLFHHCEEFVVVLENATNTVPAKGVLYEIGLKSRTGQEIEIDSRLESHIRVYFFERAEVEKERQVYFSDGNITLFCFMRLTKPSSAVDPQITEFRLRNIYGQNIPVSSYSFEFFGELSLESPESLQVFWKIPDYYKWMLRNDYSRMSPEFFFGNDRYCLWLSPSDRKCPCIKLVNVSDSIPESEVSYEVGLKSSSGGKINLSSNKPYGQFMLTQSIPFRGQILVGKEFFIRDVDYSGLPSGTVTIFCSLRLRDTNSAGDGTSNKEEAQARLAGKAKLQSDYKELLEKGWDSDACLVVRGKEFPAHKNILRARSSVFDAMFSHEMAEKESGRVVIDDLDPENFGDFLEYLYTGVVGAGLSDDNVFELYKAAHKYDVLPLKSECVVNMLRYMSVDFFCDTIILALRYNEQELLQKAIEFFQRKMAQIIVTEKWQQFLIEDSTNANKLLIQAMTLKKQ